MGVRGLSGLQIKGGKPPKNILELKVRIKAMYIVQTRLSRDIGIGHLTENKVLPYFEREAATINFFV